MASRSPIESGLQPLDQLRRWLLRSLMPWIRPLIRDRSGRVALTGVILLSTAFLGTVWFPLWMLALGPIIWGVPHILSDVRYLVIRSGYIQRPMLWWCGGLPLLAITLGGGLKAGVLGCMAVLWVARSTTQRKLFGTLLLGVLFYGVVRLGYTADLLFAHIHNFIAVALWWAWRPREGRHWFPLLLFIGLSVALLCGLAEPLLNWNQALQHQPPGNGIGYHLTVLAPGLPAPWDLRLVLLFAFAQSVHYVIWIRLIPEDDRPQPTPRSFTSSYRALRQDFGLWPLLLTFVFAVGIVGWALFDLAQARVGYLRLAIFHGHLELMAATLLWSEGRPS